MSAKGHVIEIYDPYDYEGPKLIKAAGLGIVRGPDKAEFYLLELRKPFEYRGHQVTQLLVQPRYFGDKIARVVNDACTVGIMRVKPDSTLSPELPLSHSSCAFWGAGKITPTRLDA